MFNAADKIGLHGALYSGIRTGYAPHVPTGEAGRGPRPQIADWSEQRNPMLRKTID